MELDKDKLKLLSTGKKDEANQEEMKALARKVRKDLLAAIDNYKVQIHKSRIKVDQQKKNFNSFVKSEREKRTNFYSELHKEKISAEAVINAIIEANHTRFEQGIPGLYLDDLDSQN